MSAKQEAKAAPDMVTLEVDGKSIQAPKGAMLIQATDAAGIYIPHFCYHKHLSVAANCRMCLVEVEKAPKPLPACATPVMDGMKVYTRSEKARDAQKGTMEFLLINHPLDCPICDQGGECQLQDLAVGYGKDVSRYHETKRIIKDKDLGPLIATDMTRCIHCTRCVRFGQEVAGVMEFGALGRGEHMEIRTFLDRSVDSEVSGNVIDLCPVGALTSKPFRYRARPWELESHASVSPHDCVGANLYVQTRRGEVMRVLPRENDAINGVWISDRDRFSYEALNSEERLRAPMIRENGKWRETDWNIALERTVSRLKNIIDVYGAEEIGALVSPTATLEEFYLLQKFMRALGSGNVDHRLRQMDFSDDANAPVFPWLGQTFPDLENLDAVLLVGSNVRKDQPLIGLRLRKAHLKGAKLMAINPVDYAFTFKLAHKVITDPLNMVHSLAGVAKALSALKTTALPDSFTSAFGGVESDDTERAVAETLASHHNAAVLLGNLAASHPQASRLRALAELIAEMSGAKLGHLPEANAAAAWLAGCVPHRDVAGSSAKAGRHAAAMLREPLKAYILFGMEPELDCLCGAHARSAMEAAEFVVMATAFEPSSYHTRALDYAEVLLPLAPFTETAGTFVTAAGQRQAFDAATKPLGEARPGWKILRMLGHLMGQAGFDQATLDDVRAEIDTSGVVPAAGLKSWQLSTPPSLLSAAPAQGQLMRIAEVPIYAVDTLVRRAPALQACADNPQPSARVNASQAQRLGVNHGDVVVVRMLEGEAQLNLVIDPRVPEGCVLVPSGYPETAMLGAHGPATVVRVPS